MKVLIVVDMQNDFITGSLGTKEAESIVSKVKEKIDGFDGKIYFTRDTHEKNYLETQEGKKLPVSHCIKGTSGHDIVDSLQKPDGSEVIDKPSFGSITLGEKLLSLNKQEPIESITLVGLCTDICVISNAFIIKAFLPEVRIIVDAECCAGVTPESHRQALEAMKVCQIEIINQ